MPPPPSPSLREVISTDTCVRGCSTCHMPGLAPVVTFFSSLHVERFGRQRASATVPKQTVRSGNYASVHMWKSLGFLLFLLPALLAAHPPWRGTDIHSTPPAIFIEFSLLGPSEWPLVTSSVECVFFLSHSATGGRGWRYGERKTHSVDPSCFPPPQRRHKAWPS